MKNLFLRVIQMRSCKFMQEAAKIGDKQLNAYLKKYKIHTYSNASTRDKLIIALKTQINGMHANLFEAKKVS